MPGPFLPVWALSRSQGVRIGNRATGAGSHVAPMLTKNPSTAALPTPLLVDLSDGPSRRDLGHHIAVGAVVPAHSLRLTNSLAANAAITTGPTLVNNLLLPANALNVGATIRVTAQGITSATGNITASTRIGTAGTTADATITGTLFTAVAGTTGGGGWFYEALITVQAVGSGTSGKLVANASLSAHSNLVYGTNNVAQTNVDTTVGEFVDFVVGVSAGTITVTNSLVEFLDSAF